MQADGVDLTRRRLLGMAGAGMGAVAVDALLPNAASAMPAPTASGIEHIVVVMMENRSFDHYLGWLPGANGKQAGLTYRDRKGVAHTTHHLTTYQGCAFADPDHSFEGGRTEWHSGRNDGWLRAGDNDTFSIGYYLPSDLSFYSKAARDWTVCDRYFSATMAETYPNRFYQHSAQTDRLHNNTDISTMPTIWDRLADAGVSRRYYYSDVPFLALYGTKYLPISAPFATFLTDARAGLLPAVSFVDPRFLDEGSGTSGDDHPHADIRAGQYFLNQIYDAVRQGPGWKNTVLVINYDEWGGFFDHVPPRVVPDARPEWGTGLRGFRVPCLVMSPFAKRRYVAHNEYDHTSVLKMIEWRHHLAPLTPRDAHARNLAEVLDFSRPGVTATPTYDVPPFLGGASCQPVDPDDYEEWRTLQAHAHSLGWELP
jgi:phospholipase C